MELIVVEPSQYPKDEWNDGWYRVGKDAHDLCEVCGCADRQLHPFSKQPVIVRAWAYGPDFWHGPILRVLIICDECLRMKNNEIVQGQLF